VLGICENPGARPDLNDLAPIHDSDTVTYAFHDSHIM
jgi:hypothetical protein